MSKTKSTTRTWAAAVSMALAAFSAQAALDTSDGDYTGPFIDLASRVDLCACGVPSGQAQIDANYGYTFGPVDLPGMVFTRSQSDTNSGLGAVLGQGEYGLTGNGGFGAGAVYAGLDGWGGYMDFTLTGAPVSEFGAYVNYAVGGAGEGEEVGGNPYIAALGADGSVLESWDLSVWAPVSTPGGFNEFAFRGISRDSADIFGLRFGNGYIIAAGTATGALPPTDGPVAPVPEPSTYALMLVGLGAMAVVARRRRNAA
jgi:hypothetical protein